MGEVIYKTIFKFKRGQSEAWWDKNPVLQNGEPGYELDTGKLKIGDGVTDWRTLRYFGGNYSVSADEKSITVSLAGLELYGFSDAKIGQIPSKGESGKITWVDKIGAQLDSSDKELLIFI